MKIYIEKGYLCALLIAMIGIAFLAAGIKNCIGIRDAVSMEELSFAEAKAGQYVNGYIQEYAGKKVVNLGDGRFYGEAYSFTAGILGKEYIGYTVRLSENQFITVLVGSERLREQLLNYTDGQGNCGYLEGKIIKIPVSLNHGWLAEALGVEDEKQIEQMVSPVYAIKEVSFRDEKKWCIYGISFLVTAAVIAIGIGRNGIQIVKNESDVPRCKPKEADCKREKNVK